MYSVRDLKITLIIDAMSVSSAAVHSPRDTDTEGPESLPSDVELGKFVHLQDSIHFQI